MNVIVSHITSFPIVYWTVYLGADQRKRQGSASLPFSEGNSQITGEFPAQRASNAENVSISLRHHAERISPELPRTFPCHWKKIMDLSSLSTWYVLCIRVGSDGVVVQNIFLLSIIKQRKVSLKIGLLIRYSGYCKVVCLFKSFSAICLVYVLRQSYIIGTCIFSVEIWC